MTTPSKSLARFALILVSALALTAWMAVAVAQEPDAEYEMTEFENDDPSEQDIIDALTPRPPLPTRALDGEAPGMKLRAIPLRIRFELNSFQLTEAAQKTLNRLGSALTSPALADYQFRVEGHTDAQGDETYNLDLSRRRAEGVRNYLINLFEMESGRLETVARGESSLLNPDEPNSPDNRVVLIVNLGPAEG
ncbi:MAG: OmpA family protein [Pseudomonadota bacterium]